MKKSLLFTLLTFGIAALAQPGCEFCGPPSEWDPSANHATATLSGANFHVNIPVAGMAAPIKIRNLAPETNDLLIVGVNADGETQLKLVRIPGGQSLFLESETWGDSQWIHLLSLENFYAETQETLTILGTPTNHFAATKPRFQFRRLSLHDRHGNPFTAAVTPDGEVHYPVMGYPFGRLQGQDRQVIGSGGQIMDIDP